MTLDEKIREIRKIIKDNADLRTKEVGDRVLIWDWSFAEDSHNNRFHIFSGYNGKEGIVVKTNCNRTVTNDIRTRTYTLDLLVWFNDVQIFTSSDFVRIIS